MILTVADPNNLTQTDNSELLNVIYKSYTTDNVNEKMTFENNMNNNNNNDNKINNNDNNNINKNNENYNFKSGDLLIHGRSQKDWNLISLRDRILFLKEDDLQFNLPAGKNPFFIFIFYFLEKIAFSSYVYTHTRTRTHIYSEKCFFLFLPFPLCINLCKCECEYEHLKCIFIL